jgi:hypothetical protein
LLCSRAEWEEHRAELIRLWEQGRPEDARIAYRPLAGDVVVVEDLSTVHTAVGCIVEEFANSSYDAVLRLHDQNAGRTVTLPAEHTPVTEVLAKATALQPRRRVHRAGGEWVTAEVGTGVVEITSLPELGLVGRHVPLAGSASRAGAGPSGISGTVGAERVLTVFVLTGSVYVQVDAAKFELRAGDVTALAPNSGYRIVGADDESRLSLCEVSADVAFADLR